MKRYISSLHHDSKEVDTSILNIAACYFLIFLQNLVTIPIFLNFLIVLLISITGTDYENLGILVLNLIFEDVENGIQISSSKVPDLKIGFIFFSIGFLFLLGVLEEFFKLQSLFYKIILIISLAPIPLTILLSIFQDPVSLLVGVLMVPINFLYLGVYKVLDFYLKNLSYK